MPTNSGAVAVTGAAAGAGMPVRGSIANGTTVFVPWFAT
jgi:hypothetical protein